MTRDASTPLSLRGPTYRAPQPGWASAEPLPPPAGGQGLLPPVGQRPLVSAETGLLRWQEAAAGVAYKGFDPLLRPHTKALHPRPLPRGRALAEHTGRPGGSGHSSGQSEAQLSPSRAPWGRGRARPPSPCPDTGPRPLSRDARLGLQPRAPHPSPSRVCTCSERAANSSTCSRSPELLWSVGLDSPALPPTAPPGATAGSVPVKPWGPGCSQGTHPVRAVAPTLGWDGARGFTRRGRGTCHLSSRGEVPVPVRTNSCIFHLSLCQHRSPPPGLALCPRPGTGSPSRLRLPRRPLPRLGALPPSGTQWPVLLGSWPPPCPRPLSWAWVEAGFR